MKKPTYSNYHPYECEKAACIHCLKKNTKIHNPRQCDMCLDDLSEQVVVNLAKKFHSLYEELAPQFGYITRKETRVFDVSTKNSQLMIAVCRKLLADLVL